jgi:CRP-like cAMP-binding protein
MSRQPLTDPLRFRALAPLLTESTLLASLPAEVIDRLLPHFSLIDLPAGQVLSDAPTRAIFPLVGVISLVQELPDGDCAQVALVGREGLLGLPLFMGGSATPTRGGVQCPGYGLALSRDRLLEEFERGGAFMRQLLRYTQALITQISQLVVCNRHHSIEQQLCRLLVMSLDRLRDQEVPLTQEFAARLLGVRREGVTEASGRLREAGLVSCRRGLFSVQSRRLLECRACDCYRVVKDEYDRLLPASVNRDLPASVPALPPQPSRPTLLPPLPAWRPLGAMAA